MNLLVRAVFDDSPSDADEEMAVESLIEMQANVCNCLICSIVDCVYRST
jgi:hypothetical protein